MFPIFPSRNEYQKQNPNESSLDRLAKAISNIALFPIKLFATFFLLPILIPLAILHSFIVIGINTFVLFTHTFLLITFFSLTALSTLCLFATNEILLPLGLITLLFISTIAITSIQNQLNEEIKLLNEEIKHLFKSFTIL